MSTITSDPTVPHSTASPTTNSTPVSIGGRQRVAIGSYDEYTGAQAAVDRLSDNGFAVEHLAIVGEGMKMVEQVTGKMSWWRGMLRGAFSGLLIGLTVGLLLGLFTVDPVAFIPMILWSALYGLVIGAILGVLGYALTGGKRDFTSAGGFAAERYVVYCDVEQAAEAQRKLSA